MRPPAALRTRRTLLLVESERAFGAVLSGWLSGLADAEVIQTASLREARAALQSNRIELMVSAVELADGNGLDLLKEKSLGGIPRLFLSSQDEAERRELAATAGVGILEKPVVLAALRDQIWMLLPESRGRATPALGTRPVAPVTPAPKAPSVQPPPVVEKVSEEESQPVPVAATRVEEEAPVPAAAIRVEERAPVPAAAIRVEERAPIPAAEENGPEEAEPVAEAGPAGPATLPAEGPRTIPSGFVSVAPAVDAFETLWEQARELMANQDYARALQQLKRAEALRPGEERIAKSLRRLQILGYGARG